MATFNPIIITTAGQDLLSQAVAGQGTLTFTAVSTSSAVVQYDVATVQAMTELSDIQQTSTPISAILQDGTAQVSALFSNTLLTQGYAANTLGLYASIGSGSQTLFAVAIATEPDNIPAQSGLSPSNFYYQFNITISDTSQITISVPQDGNLPASVFNQIFPGIQAPTAENDGDLLTYGDGTWSYISPQDINALEPINGSGESMSFQNSLAAPFISFGLTGNTELYNGPAYNLINYNLFKDNTFVNVVGNQIIVTQQEGDETHQSYDITLQDLIPSATAGNTYYLSGVSNDPLFNGLYIGSTPSGTLWQFGQSLQLTEELLSTKYIEIVTTGGTGQSIVTNMMVTESGQGMPWVPYTSEASYSGDPAPENPIPIVSVGDVLSGVNSDAYQIAASITGDQLFDASKLPTNNNDYVTIANNDDGSFTLAGTGTVVSGLTTSYNISHSELLNLFKAGNITLKAEGSTNALCVEFVLLKGLSSYIDIITSNQESVVANITQDMLDDVNSSAIIRVRSLTGSTASAITIKPVLYQNGDGTWEPFQTPQAITLTANRPLSKWDNLVLKDGQWMWEYNSATAVFDGSTDKNWILAGEATSLRIGLKVGNKNSINEAFCTRFILGNSQNGNGQFDAIGNYLRFNINGIATDIESWETWLQSNPITVLYQLAEPEYVPLDADQQALLNALHSNNPSTNIFTNMTFPPVISATCQGQGVAPDLAQDVLDLHALIGTPSAGNIPIVDTEGNYTYQSIADTVYPVGSIYLSVNNINPGTLFGGTWVAWGSGQVPVGVDTNVTQFATVEQTGGEIEHTLILDEIPEHDHLDVTTGDGVDALPVTAYRWDDGGGLLKGPASGITSSGYQVATNNPIVSNGGGQAHNNLQPYITCYMWKRTA